MADSLYTSQWAAPPLKLPPSYGGIWILSTTWFIWHQSQHVKRNLAISIGSAIFTGLTTVTDGTDRQTDRQTTLLRL